MKITWRIFYLVFLVCCISGCKDSEDAVSQDSSYLQVAVAFYPGQVGDHGYADGIMECLPQIGKAQSANQDLHIDAQFFALDSKQEVLRSLRYWSSHPENPFQGGNYQRRLLVLTDARQVAWLDGMKPENSQDELLLLNTAKDVVDSLAQTWGNRVHALNISVAHEMEAYCRYIQRSLADEGGQEGAGQNCALDIFRMEGCCHTADSVDVVCHSKLGETVPVEVNYLQEWLTDSVTGELDYVASQQYARFLAEFYFQYNKDHFLFLDGAAYNLVFDEMSPKTDEAGSSHILFLDMNRGTDNYCVWRQYGRALISWIEEWSHASSPEALPRITWHGSWDGYVDSSVPE